MTKEEKIDAKLIALGLFKLTPGYKAAVKVMYFDAYTQDLMTHAQYLSLLEKLK